jgi:hypothetical protein
VPSSNVEISWFRRVLQRSLFLSASPRNWCRILERHRLRWGRAAFAETRLMTSSERTGASKFDGWPRTYLQNLPDFFKNMLKKVCETRERNQNSVAERIELLEWVVARRIS